MNVREAQKVANEYLRPLNQGLENLGSATNFQHYVETTYRPVVMPGMANSTQRRTNGVLQELPDSRVRESVPAGSVSALSSAVLL